MSARRCASASSTSPRARTRSWSSRRFPYLDVIRAVRERFDAPLFAYNVSGEYAMVKAAAARGWLDERQAALEGLTAIKRAGADVIVSYWARELAEWL